MSTFSAEQLAQILHPQELEILEEIAYEFEDPDEYGEDDTASRPVLSHNLAHLIVQASHDLQGYRGPKPKKTKSKKKSKSKKADNLSPLDRERFEELGEEIEENEMGTRRLPAVPTRDEVLHLLQTTQNHKSRISKRDYLIIRLMYATGCRRSELENMRLADMNYKEQRVFVRDGKWDKDRYVLIDKKTAELMENFTYGLGLSDPIFDIGDRQINRRIIHWAEVAGLAARYDAQGRTFTSHSLRHAYATHLHESRFDLYALKNLMGHRFFTTTKIYIHIAVNNWLEQYERCHPLASNED
jgi:integrase